MRIFRIGFSLLFLWSFFLGSLLQASSKEPSLESETTYGCFLKTCLGENYSDFLLSLPSSERTTFDEGYAALFKKLDRVRDLPMVSEGLLSMPAEEICAVWFVFMTNSVLQRKLNKAQRNFFIKHCMIALENRTCEELHRAKKFCLDESLSRIRSDQEIGAWQALIQALIPRWIQVEAFRVRLEGEKLAEEREAARRKLRREKRKAFRKTRRVGQEKVNLGGEAPPPVSPVSPTKKVAGI